MGYSGKFKVKGWAKTTRTTSEAGGEGEFYSSDKDIARELARSTPHGVGHAIDSAVDLHKYRIYRDEDLND